MVGAVFYSRPFTKLLLRIDDLISAYSLKQIFLHILFSDCYHIGDAQFFQQGGSDQGALEIISHGNKTDIKIANAQGPEEFLVRTVPNLAAGQPPHGVLHRFPAPVNAHDFVSELTQPAGCICSESAQSDHQYGFHALSSLTLYASIPGG